MHASLTSLPFVSPQSPFIRLPLSACTILSSSPTLPLLSLLAKHWHVHPAWPHTSVDSFSGPALHACGKHFSAPSKLFHASRPSPLMRAACDYRGSCHSRHLSACATSASVSPGTPKSRHLCAPRRRCERSGCSSSQTTSLLPRWLLPAPDRAGQPTRARWRTQRRKLPTPIPCPYPCPSPRRWTCPSSPPSSVRCASHTSLRAARSRTCKSSVIPVPMRGPLAATRICYALFRVSPVRIRPCAH